MEYESTNKTKGINDYIMSLNQFGEQVELTGTKAIINQFLNLLFMKKNSCQKHPTLGFNIKSRIHSLDKDENLLSMQNELLYQARKFIDGPIYDVEIKKANQKGDIIITVDIESDGGFKINLDNENLMDIEIEIPQKKYR